MHAPNPSTLLYTRRQASGITAAVVPGCRDVDEVNAEGGMKHVQPNINTEQPHVLKMHGPPQRVHGAGLGLGLG